MLYGDIKETSRINNITDSRLFILFVNNHTRIILPCKACKPFIVWYIVIFRGHLKSTIYWYYIVYILRRTWLLFIKESKVGHIYRKFNMDQTQFQTKIQVSKTDNVKEYFKKELDMYLEKMELFLRVHVLIIFNKIRKSKGRIDVSCKLSGVSCSQFKFNKFQGRDCSNCNIPYQ